MIEIMMIRPEKEIGMGCCGGICEDEGALINMKNEFNHYDSERKRLGQLYRETMDAYQDQVTITYFDPRNILAIGGYFFKQILKRQINVMEAFRCLFVKMKYGAIFVNGKFVDNENEYVEKTQENLR